MIDRSVRFGLSELAQNFTLAPESRCKIFETLMVLVLRFLNFYVIGPEVDRSRFLDPWDERFTVDVTFSRVLSPEDSFDYSTWIISCFCKVGKCFETF